MRKRLLARWSVVRWNVKGALLAAGMRKFEYEGRKWHEECFQCDECHEPIRDQKFAPASDERVICVQCYERAYAPRCHVCKGVSFLPVFTRPRAKFWKLLWKIFVKSLYLRPTSTSYSLFPDTVYIGFLLTFSKVYFTNFSNCTPDHELTDR